MASAETSLPQWGQNANRTPLGVERAKEAEDESCYGNRDDQGEDECPNYSEYQHVCGSGTVSILEHKESDYSANPCKKEWK